MEEEKFYEFGIMNDDIGIEAMSEFKRVSKNINIRKGMKKTIKNVGRPTKIFTKQLNKAYGLWMEGQATQREIAEALNVSERTINRKFRKLKGEENETNN